MTFILYPPSYFEKIMPNCYCSSEINFGDLNSNFWRFWHLKRQRCSYSWVLSEHCVESNLEGAWPLRHSHYGDVGPTVWQQGETQCEMADEPQTTESPGWILCSCLVPTGMSSKCCNNQFWPGKHVTPGAVITQTMDEKGSVYQGLGWVGFSRVSMCFCSVFILCICFLYMINNYRTHSSKQTYSLPQAKGNTMKTHAWHDAVMTMSQPD